MKSGTKPKVTIAIPTCNRAELLRQAIESALAQTYPNLEIIVSNNASTDTTKELLSSYGEGKIIAIQQTENVGMRKNWNACLERATGDYFLLLSDDDMLEQNAIENLLQGFCNDSISISYGLVSYIDKYGQITGEQKLYAPQNESGHEFILKVLQKKRVAYPSAVLYRTVEAREVGGYPDIGSATDFGLLMLLALKGLVFFYSHPVTKYRIHDDSLSLSEGAMLSQLSLYNWAKDIHHLQDIERQQLQQYCTEMIYKFGRNQALRGNDAASAKALAALNKIKPSFKWELKFFFFKLTPIRWLAIIRGKLFMILK